MTVVAVEKEVEEGEEEEEEKEEEGGEKDLSHGDRAR